MHKQVEQRGQLPRDVEVAGEVGGGFEALPGEVGGGAVEVDGEVGGGVDVASRNHLAVIQRLSIKYSSSSNDHLYEVVFGHYRVQTISLIKKL